MPYVRFHRLEPVLLGGLAVGDTHRVVTRRQTRHLDREFLYGHAALCGG